MTKQTKKETVKEVKVIEPATATSEVKEVKQQTGATKTITTCKGNVITYKAVSNRALKAKITAFSDAQRTKVVAQFDTFVDAKKWLEVTNVGTSLENASATGKMSRGYYWKVVM